MKTLVLTAAIFLGAAGAAFAASAVNRDAQPRTLVVTEGGSRQELAIGAGETVEFCRSGCFVTMPNGDRAALTGNEAIEILDGVGRIR